MKNNSAGALLFAIITAFVLSLVGATLAFLTSNQYRLINSGIERTIASYRAQAGMEYAIWWARTNPGSLPANPGDSQDITPDPAPAALNNVTITITNIDADNLGDNNEFQNLSDYGIQVTCSYES